MNRLLTFARDHERLLLIAAAVLIVLLFYFGSSIKQRVRDWKTDSRVEKLEHKSEANQKQASSEITEADKTSGARAAEDERRELEIKPQLERARVTREQARANTQKAAQEDENSRQKISSTAGVDVRALHERNVSDFCELYPNEPGCSR